MERDAKSIGERLGDLVRRCRQAGMNVTPQRLSIYRALLESEDHPSPELLFERVRARMPSLSLATIYKALDALQRLGVVGRVAVAGDRKRYDANPDRHHHLVCTRCDKVVDFYDDALNAIAPPRRVAGFVPHAVHVQVTGLCASCARRPRH
jgi:Fur family transcriptional regulator, peroxide stress response regulator